MTVPLQVPVQDFQQHDACEYFCSADLGEKDLECIYVTRRLEGNTSRASCAGKKKQSSVCFELAQVWWHQLLVGFMHV